MIGIVFFILGLLIGSFLNVVVLRMYQDKTMGGRSRCPWCEGKIAWYDNVPLLGFLWLKGRCRSCGRNISWQYPLVEGATGIVFAVTSLVFFSLGDSATWLPTLFHLGLFSFLIVIFVYDWLYMRIPLSVLWLAVAWTFLYFVVVERDAVLGGETLWSLKIISGLMAGAGAAGLFAFLSWVSDERWMGWGDAHVAFLFGWVTGWPWVLWGLTVAFGLGALIGSGMIFFGGKGMKTQIPFAPFLVVGIVVAVIGPHIFPVFNNYLPAMLSATGG